MTCPHCGASVQSGDLFCMGCGNALNPADPTRHLSNAVDAPYDAAPAVEAAPYAHPADDRYDEPEYSAYGLPADRPYADPQPAPYRALRPVDTQQPDRQWASGSSFPAQNPYGGTPNTVSPGTMVNGRPVGAGNGGGIFKGIGAGIAALFVVLAKAGGALAGVGLVFAKFWFWLWAFHFLFRGGLGVVALLFILLLVAGSIWQSRSRTV